MHPILKPIERRSFGRRESSVKAVVLVPGRAPVHCIVRDFSEMGAGIELLEAIKLPLTFKLRIDAKDVEAICEVRHQRGQNVGVQFLSGSAGAAIERELEERAERIREMGLDGHVVPAVRGRPVERGLSSKGSDLRQHLFGIRK
ncbi:MAG: PilZ domain-containing protein [Hyphomicrobiaceae bacterium]